MLVMPAYDKRARIDGQTWRPVKNTSPYETAKDRFSKAAVVLDIAQRPLTHSSSLNLRAALRQHLGHDDKR